VSWIIDINLHKPFKKYQTGLNKMKKITKKQIKNELDNFVANRQKINSKELLQIKKGYSYLHFDNGYFSEEYKKKDEEYFFELIFLIVRILNNAGYKIEKEIVEKCMPNNMAAYIYGSTMYDLDDKEIPMEMFDSISEKHPQRLLINNLFEWSCKSLLFKFSLFDVRVYSYVCCKSIIDAAIVISKDGFPVDDELADELSWCASGEEIEENDERLDELANLLDEDDEFLDDENDFEDIENSFNNEAYEIEQINDYLDKINSSSSVAKRRKLFKEAIEKFPNCVELRLFSANEYNSFEKIMNIYDEALEIAEKQIGSEKYFKELEGARMFWGITKTRPYMTVLFEKAQLLYEYSLDNYAADIWVRMLDLCPTDNLGVRTYLLEYFLKNGNRNEAKNLLNNYPECGLPGFIWTDIMFQLEENNDKTAKKRIKTGIGVNKHVPKLLLNKKKYQADFPGMVTIGSKHEAELYCGRFKTLWTKENLGKLKNIISELEK
jgi:hypothetical protein